MGRSAGRVPERAPESSAARGTARGPLHARRSGPLSQPPADSAGLSAAPEAAADSPAGADPPDRRAAVGEEPAHTSGVAANLQAVHTRPDIAREHTHRAARVIRATSSLEAAGLGVAHGVAVA